MIFEIRPICSWIVRSRHCACSSATFDSSSLAWPWITPIGVPISCARPATSVPIDARCSAARARSVVWRSSAPCVSKSCASCRPELASSRFSASRSRSRRVDVVVHGQGRVEEEELLQRHQRALGARDVRAVALEDERREQQREVERVRTEVPGRLEPDPLVGPTDPPPLREVRLVDLRAREAQQVLPLLAEEPLLHRGVAEELARHRVGEEMPVEGGDERVRALLEDGPQVGEDAPIGVTVVEVGDALFERLGKGHRATLSEPPEQRQVSIPTPARFMLRAEAMEAAAMTTGQSAKGTVGEIMQRDPMTLRADDHFDMTEDLMSLGRVRHLPVLDGERLVGVVSLRDLLACSLTRALDFDARERRVFLKSVDVREAMSKRLITVQANATREEAASLMLRNWIGCLPVVDASGRLIGIVTETDLIRAAYLGGEGPPGD